MSPECTSRARQPARRAVLSGQLSRAVFPHMRPRRTCYVCTDDMALGCFRRQKVVFAALHQHRSWRTHNYRCYLPPRSLSGRELPCLGKPALGDAQRAAHLLAAFFFPLPPFGPRSPSLQAHASMRTPSTYCLMHFPVLPDLSWCLLTFLRRPSCALRQPQSLSCARCWTTATPSIALLYNRLHM